MNPKWKEYLNAYLDKGAASHLKRIGPYFQNAVDYFTKKYNEIKEMNPEINGGHSKSRTVKRRSNRHSKTKRNNRK